MSTVLCMLAAFGAACLLSVAAFSVENIDSASSPTQKLAAARLLVDHSDKIYSEADFAAPAGRLNAASGFKARWYVVEGTVVVAFAGTEELGKYGKALAEEGALLAQGARLGGWQLAAVLFMYRLAAGQLPEVPADLRTDAELLVGARPLQFIEAAEFAQAAREQAKGRSIIFTGHSLGGGLASYAATLINGDAVTFNAPYLNDQLRADRPLNATGRVRSFEAVRSSGVALNRDAISSVTHHSFGDDPLVKVIDVPVAADDVLLHGLDHFRLSQLAERGKIYWVRPGRAQRVQLADGKHIELAPGTPMLARSREGERLTIGWLGVRRGYVWAPLVGKPVTLGRLTLGTVLGRGNVQLRSAPGTSRPSILSLPVGLRVQILETVDGEAVEGGTKWHRVEFMVIQGGVVEGLQNLTQDPVPLDLAPPG